VIVVDGSIRIGELARRTGVSPELLRAWETRYGLLRPARSPGGFRLYSPADETRIRRMTGLIADGVSAAEAARHALTGDEAAATSDAPILERLSDRLRAALDDFDGAGAHSAFDRLLASVSVDVVLADVVLPYLRDLGDRWAAGRASVAQEHFASNLIRGRLLALARDWDSGNGPMLLLSCLPGEAHDLGLIIFGILAARRGWRVTFLGADTPLDTVEAVVREVQPSLTVLVALNRSLMATHADDLRRLTALTRTAIAGTADTQAAVEVGATALPTDIARAASSLVA
jgi:MerR family transcriptional regulator, light-induced transcriptional regulator